MSARVGVLILILAVVVGLSACGPRPAPELTPGEDELTGIAAFEVADQGARFIVGPLPFGWKRMMLEGGATVGFTNRFHDQTIFVNVLYAPNRRAGLTALRNHLLFDLTSREILEQETIEVDNREALWTVIKGRLDGARVKMALVVVRIDDWVYDLAYIAVPETYEICLADFRQMVNAFHHKRNYPDAE